MKTDRVQIHIPADGGIYCSRANRWLTTETDTSGFAKWALENQHRLRRLGSGIHSGTWDGETFEAENQKSK